MCTYFYDDDDEADAKRFRRENGNFERKIKTSLVPLAFQLISHLQLDNLCYSKKYIILDF
jgi:hypothetical protein